MTEHSASTRPPTIHWVGAGLSTGSGLTALARDHRLVLWARTADKAAACADRLGARVAAARAFERAALAAELVAGDVLVSMLPASQHAELLLAAVDAGAHFACSSYTSPELAELAARARSAGLVVLTEAGLDPGIDHLLAHQLIAEAIAELGDGPATVSLTSYCGGVPAVANEFRYLFSWAPQGVLNALLSPARFVEDGTAKEVARPWEAVHPYHVLGEDFEVYPNRDSLPFIQQYGVPDRWTVDTFIRGTLRLPGWQCAWRDVFGQLATRGAAAVPELAADLARRYPMTDTDRDRVVLVVELVVESQNGSRFCRSRVLDLVGDDTEAAMSRCVSAPLAVGVDRLLAGALPPGLNRAAETATEAAAWLAALSKSYPMRVIEHDASNTPIFHG